MHMKIMNNDPGILCVNHCCSSARIFCLSLPTKCPLCSADFSSSTLYPFSIPYPFIRASQHPCSVVLKPTQGSFLRDYKNAQDLHIGVTDSNSKVFAFDERGLQIGTEALAWEQCLAIPGFSSQQLHLLQDTWDSALQGVETDKRWSPEQYKEDGLNCYSFVLSFLQAVKISAISSAAVDKATFCAQVLLPYTTTAAKYITLYRNVIRNGIFVKHKEN